MPAYKLIADNLRRKYPQMSEASNQRLAESVHRAESVIDPEQLPLDIFESEEEKQVDLETFLEGSDGDAPLFSDVLRQEDRTKSISAIQGNEY